MTTNATRRLSKALGLLGLIMVLGACSSLPRSTVEPTATQGAAAFWEGLRVNGDEAQSFTSLKAMADQSDAVVVGVMDAVKVGRTIETDSPDDTVAYIQVDLRVVRTLRGVVPSEVVPLEFVYSGLGVNASDSVHALAEMIPSAPIVVFLHEKLGRGEDGLYRTTSSRGLWAESASGLEAPLAEDGPGLYGEELRSARTLDDLTAVIVGL